MATHYFDPVSGWKTWALQARTDEVGAAEDDFDGQDARSFLRLFTAGVVTPADAFLVAERAAGANMSVDVCSGTAWDLAVVEGDDAGQFHYAAAIGDATVNATIEAADLSNSRIDGVFLVVQDDAFDSSGNVVPRIAIVDGTPASSPSAPSPDGSWTASLRLADILVPAGTTDIENADITDQRVRARVVDDGVSTDSIQDGAVTGAKIAGTAIASHLVRARVQDLTGSGISTTEATEMSATLSIPADWGTYDIEAWLSASVYRSGTLTDIRTVALRLRLTDASGTIIGVNSVDLEGSVSIAQRSSVSCVGYRTGLTSTGSVVVVATSRITDDSGQAAWDNGTLILHAYRTS
jgi:hypothetical protein